MDAKNAPKGARVIGGTLIVLLIIAAVLATNAGSDGALLKLLGD